jgi:hypothetical protein
MRLVYTATQKTVAVGDTVTVDGQEYTVDFFRQPTSAASEGKVTIMLPKKNPKYTMLRCGRELYVSAIGAEWIEREDRANLPPVRIVRRAAA